jgi:hypothetical protein
VRLVLVIPAHGVRAEQRVALRESGIEVGGAADCDGIVDDVSVGTARVRIEKRADAWIVVDTDGRGVCSLGGVPLRPRQPRVLRPPHALRMGTLDLCVVLDAESDDASTCEVAFRAAALVEQVAPVRPRIRVVEGARMGETMELSHAATFRIGRAPSCELSLESAGVSREHCAVEWDGARVLVRDLGSAWGTLLGAHRLVPHQQALWEPWRMLRVVDTVFALEVAVAGTSERLLAAATSLTWQAVAPVTLRLPVPPLVAVASPEATTAPPPPSLPVAPPATPRVERIEPRRLDWVHVAVIVALTLGLATVIAMVVMFFA